MVYTLTVHLYANDKPDSIERIKAKLIEAARVYRKDKETVDWIVMQDVHDPRAFTIVERFEQESVSSPEVSKVNQRNLTLLQSQKYHLENPYWQAPNLSITFFFSFSIADSHNRKTFDPYVVPLLDKPMDLRRHEELDTSKDVVVPV